MPLTATGALTTFSRTVMCGNRLKLWKTMPTSRRSPLSRVLRSRGNWPSWRSRVTPPIRTRPESRSSSPFRQRSSVDLPHPEGPIITTSADSGTAKLTPLMASADPKALRRSSTLIRSTWPELMRPPPRRASSPAAHFPNRGRKASMAAAEEEGPITHAARRLHGQGDLQDRDRRGALGGAPAGAGGLGHLSHLPGHGVLDRTGHRLSRHPVHPPQQHAVAALSARTSGGSGGGGGRAGDLVRDGRHDGDHPDVPEEGRPPSGRELPVRRHARLPDAARGGPWTELYLRRRSESRLLEAGPAPRHADVPGGD